MISRTGKVEKPFFIYKGVPQMENRVPGVITKNYNCATSFSGFINKPIFHEWISDHFPAPEDKWSLLLTNRNLFHTSDRVIITLINNKFISLYFPSHMTNILQHLDRSCFGHAKILHRRQIFYNFCAGLSPTKAHFFETYINIRKEAYSFKTIIGGWKRCGLFPNNPDVTLSEYGRQIHHGVITPEDPVQKESVIEPKVENISTSALQKNTERASKILEILESYHFLKQMLL